MTQRYVVEHDAIGGGFYRGDLVDAAMLETSSRGRIEVAGREVVNRLLEIGALREATADEAKQTRVILPKRVGTVATDEVAFGLRRDVQRLTNERDQLRRELEASRGSQGNTAA